MNSMSKDEISSCLNIGPDFLFVDSFIFTIPGVESKALYHFDERHTFIKHHFVSEVVIPGVLILESMLQSMALTIYQAESWKGTALISRVNSQFFELLPLNSTIENISIIRVNSGGHVEGEVMCQSDGNTISKISCTFFSDYIFNSKNKIK